MLWRACACMSWWAYACCDVTCVSCAYCGGSRFVLVGVIATWHLMADKTVPLVGYYDKNVLAVTRALLASSDPRLRVAGAETVRRRVPNVGSSSTT